MFDKRAAKLLSYLGTICKDDSYKIIEIVELKKAISPRNHIEDSNLGQIIQTLKDNELIEVKYSDDKVYCIAVLSKGRVAREERGITGKKPGLMGKTLILLLLSGCFLAAFVGALLGGLLSNMF